jgi:hypothetical protein
MGFRWGIALAVGVALAAAPASADPVGDSLVEQSCRELTAGTMGTPDDYASPSPGQFPASWPEAPAGLLPGTVPMRTQSTTFNRLYEFATTGGTIYGRIRDTSDPWREVPIPLCFAGRVASISLDDDELIALDTTGRIFGMDNVLKDPSSFNWTSRWGPPFWTGPGYQLPTDLRAWSWSVLSKVEDHNWTDPAGNRTAVGDGKVSHIWGLRRGGRRITFWDPWLPLDESYEMCGPYRGRFRSVDLSASGSWVFVIGRRGDLFARPYDFDLSGHDSFFIDYSYDDQRGAGPGAPIQLPAAPWTRLPKIAGRITDEISIHKVGFDMVHRVLRVEGKRDGRTGYWERDIADPPSAEWAFHATGLPLIGRPLHNPAADTSRIGLARGEDNRYVMRGDAMSGVLGDWNVYCSPAHLKVRENGETKRYLLHSADGLRQAPRARGLDDQPREQYAALEGPPGHFQEVTLHATRSEVVLDELGWTFARRGGAPQP